jgi:DNA-binding GntR family transcriptional regulator
MADDLRRRIQDGELTPGARVPSRVQLSRRYEVSDRVAVEAIKVLMYEGLVEGRPGSGTFVRHRPEPRRLHREAPGASPAAGLKGDGRAVSVDVEAPPSIAARLDVTPGAEVVRTDHVFLEDGEPVMLATSWEPLAITRDAAMKRPDQDAAEGRGPIERLAAVGVTVTRTVETISARPALEEESHGLGLPRGSVILVIRRTYLAGDRPVETADFVVAAEGHELSYEFALGSSARTRDG